jgi:hypothetical protein
MRFCEISTKPLKDIKPQTPDQARISALKNQKDRATQTLKTERERQKITRAQAKLADISRIGNAAN